MLIIQSERLIICPYTDQDLDPVFSYRSDPRIHMFYSITTKSKAELDTYIKESNTCFYDEKSYTIFVIKTKEQAAIIGDIAVSSWGNQNHSSAIGFCIAPEYQGQGYAKEAVKAFCDHLLQFENRLRIQADVDARNAKSISVLEYVGMKKEQEFSNIDDETGETVIEYMYGINKATNK